MANLQLVAVVLTACIGLSWEVTVCPVNMLQFLSYNATLLPPENVQASSENEGLNKIDHFTKQSTEPWCSDFGDAFSPNLHINFTFTEPVVITFLESAGFYNNFVDSFSIQYALGTEGGVLMPYGFLQVPQVFNVRHSNGKLFENTYFSLESKLVAERLRLDIRHSIFDASNRTCWSLKVLGCTFREAMIIGDEGGPGDGVGGEPCLMTTNGGMMIVNTVYPEPTGLPSEPCIGPANTETDPAISTERMLTIIVPVAVAAIVVCALIVGIGILCCYVIVAKKTQQIGKSHQEGVTVKVLGHRNVPVPVEPGNEQKAFVANGTMSSRKDSMCSDSDSFHYDMPRATMYDVPRTPPQRQRAGTASSSNEYRNPIYDGASSKESNTYESIPYDLERMGQRTRAASENLSKAESQARRASDMMLPRVQGRESDPAMHSSDPQMVQYSIVDKSRKTKEPVPVFEVLYDQSSKDDIDTPITS